jgi:hypothetical protein
MVVFAGGATNQMFIVNPSGQLTGKMEIKEFPDADPVLLDEGLVVPSPSRLKLVAMSSTKRQTQDWMAPIGDGAEHRWLHLIRIDGRELIACDGNGRLTRIQYRTGDISHLAEVSQLLSLGVRQIADTIFAVACDGTLYRLD